MQKPLVITRARTTAWTQVDWVPKVGALGDAGVVSEITGERMFVGELDEHSDTYAKINTPLIR